MKFSQQIAPARRILARAGVFVFVAALLTGCEKGGGFRSKSDKRTLVLSGDTIRLESGVTLHDVSVRAGTNADFSPATITAKSGDVIRFTVDDTRTHALVVNPPSDQARQLLSANGQLRSVPLVAKGQAWVMSLKGIPAGTYTISCISHAGTASIVVQ